MCFYVALRLCGAPGLRWCAMLFGVILFVGVSAIIVFGRGLVARSFLDSCERQALHRRADGAAWSWRMAVRWSRGTRAADSGRFARCALLVGDYPWARRYLAEAQADGSLGTDTAYAAARAFAKAGLADDERRLYEYVLSKEPAHPEANYCLAMYYDTQLHDRARAVYHLRLARDFLKPGSEWRRRCDEVLGLLESKKR